MNEAKYDRNGWGLAVAVSVLFNLTLLGLMAGMRALNPQNTQFAAVRIAFLPETEAAPSAKPLAQPTPKPQPLPETATPLLAAPTPAKAQQESTPAQTSTPALDIQPLHRLSQAPRFLQRLDPAYPEAERASGREAKLVVEVVIDTHGRVVEATIVKSGGPHFDQAVLSAIKQSLFVPGYIDGRSVVVRFQIPFRFQLR